MLNIIVLVFYITLKYFKGGYLHPSKRPTVRLGIVLHGYYTLTLHHHYHFQSVSGHFKHIQVKCTFLYISRVEKCSLYHIQRTTPYSTFSIDEILYFKWFLGPGGKRRSQKQMQGKTCSFITVLTSAVPRTMTEHATLSRAQYLRHELHSMRLTPVLNSGLQILNACNLHRWGRAHVGYRSCPKSRFIQIHVCDVTYLCSSSKTRCFVVFSLKAKVQYSVIPSATRLKGNNQLIRVRDMRLTYSTAVRRRLELCVGMEAD